MDSHGQGRRQGVRQAEKTLVASFPIDFTNNASGDDVLLGKWQASTLNPAALRVTAVVHTPDTAVTSSVLRVGTTAGGTDLLNDVDIKAAANTSYTPTLPFRVIDDVVSLYARVTRVGATTAGRAYVMVEELGLNVTQPPQPQS